MDADNGGMVLFDEFCVWCVSSHAPPWRLVIDVFATCPRASACHQAFFPRKRWWFVADPIFAAAAPALFGNVRRYTNKVTPGRELAKSTSQFVSPRKAATKAKKAIRPGFQSRKKTHPFLQQTQHRTARPASPKKGGGTPQKAGAPPAADSPDLKVTQAWGADTTLPPEPSMQDKVDALLARTATPSMLAAEKTRRQRALERKENSWTDLDYNEDFEQSKSERLERISKQGDVRRDRIRQRTEAAEKELQDELDRRARQKGHRMERTLQQQNAEKQALADELDRRTAQHAIRVDRHQAVVSAEKQQLADELDRRAKQHSIRVERVQTARSAAGQELTDELDRRGRQKEARFARVRDKKDAAERDRAERLESQAELTSAKRGNAVGDAEAVKAAGEARLAEVAQRRERAAAARLAADASGALELN